MKATRIMPAGLLAVVAGGLMMFNSSHAEIFQWVDEKGAVHFAEDPATIPEKYRNKTESRTTEEDSMSIEERVKAKQRDEAEIKKRSGGQKNEYRSRGQEDQSRTIQKEASRRAIRRQHHPLGIFHMISSSTFRRA
jgi:hypothetical protein